MPKSLLVLGASTDQCFMIETAQSMGLRVIAVDMNPDAPGAQIADAFAEISTRDIPALLEFVDGAREQGHEIAGVTTMGSDIPEVVAELAAHLGTPGPSREAARLATDKYLMKIRFAECGVPTAWFALIESYAELEAVVAERGFPFVLKPVDRSGSRGVFLVESGEGLRDLFARSFDYSHVGQCLVEEYLPGPQISTETLMHEGRGITPGFADRNYELLERFRPQFMENGGWVPSSLDAADRIAVEHLVVRASNALGITDGVTKGDVVMTPDGPKMIELAARLSGGDFCESLVPLGTGVNYVRTAIQLAIGEAPDIESLEPTRDRCVANRYIFAEPGRLRSIEGIEAIRAQDWIAKFELWYRPGDEIPPTTSHAERFGVFVVVGEDREEVQSRVDWVYRTLRLSIGPIPRTRPATSRAVPTASPA